MQKCSSLRLALSFSIATTSVWILFGATAHASAPTVVFEQPHTGNIADFLHIPHADNDRPRANSFNLVLWQLNPYQPNGKLVPSAWNARQNTGLYETQNITGHQESFQDKPNSTTVQMIGDAVGVYLNSSELPLSTHKDKMMITPSYQWSKEASQTYFVAPNDYLDVSLDLQVPVAHDQGKKNSNTYVTSDLAFVDQTTGTGFSFGCVLFKLNKMAASEHVGFDEDSHNIMVNSPLYRNGRVYTPAADSNLSSISTWTGWRHYHYVITYAGFKNALTLAKEEHPDTNFSLNPADYLLVRYHLNAELHFGGGGADLGWSMRQARILSFK